MEILYKPIKHWYAKIDDEGKLHIVIPTRLKNNEWFKDALIDKAEKLLTRYRKKEHIQTMDEKTVLIFWEKVAKKEIAENAKKIPPALKKILEEYALPILKEYSEKLGFKFAVANKLTIRTTKSKRWSCTVDQNISLNLSLVHLPTKYIRYVIIHEICHLKIKNHSPKFRNQVANFCPNYKLIRKEMKKMILK